MSANTRALGKSISPRRSAVNTSGRPQTSWRARDCCTSAAARVHARANEISSTPNLGIRSRISNLQHQLKQPSLRPGNHPALRHQLLDRPRAHATKLDAEYDKKR